MNNQSTPAPEGKDALPNNNGTLMNTASNTSSTQTLVSSNHGQRPTAMQKNVAPFLNKVYNMVNDPSSDDLIRWASDGKSFFVVRHEDFARSVLPRFFKHSNFSSFVRQLNMYGFHKVPHLQHGVLHSDNDSEQWEFSNPHFQRNQPDLLLLVTRKKGRESDEKESAAATTTTSNNNVTNIDLQHILEEIQLIKQHQMNISSQLKNIQNDNSILWQETISARERHQRHQETIDKILRFLASVFSNDKSMAIPRKRRYLLEAPDSDNKDQQDIEYQRYGNNTADIGTDSERPTKIHKAGPTPEFKLEDYVPGLQNYTGTTPTSTPLSGSSLKYKTSANPTSELDDAIALNDKSKQSSAVSSLRSPMSLPQDLTQVMSIQQIQGLQSLIGLAQSNPALLSQLTSDVFNNYHQNNSTSNNNNNNNNNIPANTNVAVPAPDYSPFNQSFDPSLLGTPNSNNNAIATILPSLYSAPSYNSSQQPSNTSSGISSPSAATVNAAAEIGNDQQQQQQQQHGTTPASILPRPVSSDHHATNSSTPGTATNTRPIAPDTGFITHTPSPFNSSTITSSTGTTPAKSPPPAPVPSNTNGPSLPQITNDIHGLTRTADDINSDIDTLGSNLEALAQQLGFDPTKANDDILGYVDMDKFLQAYGPGDDPSMANLDNVYPSETISPAATTPVSTPTENSGKNT